MIEPGRNFFSLITGHKFKRCSADQIVGFIPKNVPDLRADIGIFSCRINLPDKIARGLDQCPELLLALAECVLSGFLLGDIPDCTRDNIVSPGIRCIDGLVLEPAVCSVVPAHPEPV